MTSTHEHNKRLILHATNKELIGKGLAVTKTSNTAARVDLPKPNVYYYFQSKGNLYRCMLESIVEPLLQASALFRVEDDLLLVLSAYTRSKIRVSRELPHASKVFASEVMRSAPHLPKEYLDELNAQARRSVACLQTWIGRDQLAPVDSHHLLFAIWAATQTYANFDWQISIVIGKEQLSDANYDTVVETITRLVLKGYTPDEQSGKSAGQLRPLPL